MDIDRADQTGVLFYFMPPLALWDPRLTAIFTSVRPIWWSLVYVMCTYVCVCVSSSSHGLFKVNHGGVNVFMVRLFYRARMCIDSPSASLSLFFSPSAFTVFSPRSWPFLSNAPFDLGGSTATFYARRNSPIADPLIRYSTRVINRQWRERFSRTRSYSFDLEWKRKEITETKMHSQSFQNFEDVYS